MDPIRRCVQELSRLPGIGERTSTRLVYWLLSAPEETVRGIAESMTAMRGAIIECEICRNLVTESPCALCQNPERQRALVCVVEHPQDVTAIERSGDFRGLYHVLHGAISPLDGIGPEKLRVRELIERVERDQVREAILAMDPDLEGDTTALYLARQLQARGVRVTRLAHGISVGTEIEYADRLSLSRALQNRREVEERS